MSEKVSNAVDQSKEITNNQLKKSGPPFNLQQWTFGSMIGPNEITNSLPNTSIVPEELERILSIGHPDLGLLERQDQNIEATKTATNWIHLADLTYVKLKEPEYIINPAQRGYKYIPTQEPPLATKIKEVINSLCPLNFDIEFEPPIIQKMEPTKLISEVLKPFKEKKSNNSKAIVDNNQFE